MWTFSLLLKAITILYYAVLRNHSNDYKSILECYKTITKISFHPCTLSVNHRAISEWWDSSFKSHYKKTLNNRMIIMSNCTSTQCVRMYNVGCIKSWIFSNLILEISLCSSYLYSQKTVISDPCLIDWGGGGDHSWWFHMVWHWLQCEIKFCYVA